MTAAAALELEPASGAVTRRIRGLMAEQRISGSEMARRIGMEQRAFSRRHRGEVVWSIDEADVIARQLGVELGVLLADRGTATAGASAPAAGGMYAIADSNREPAVLERRGSLSLLSEYRAGRSDNERDVAQVTPLAAGPSRRHLSVAR